MSMSVPKLAKKLGLTSQAVQQRMRNIPDFIYNYTSKPHRSRIVSDKGVNILLNHNSINTKGHVERKHEKQNHELINQLRNDLKYSHQREAISTKQIKALNDQIKNMTLTTNNLYERYHTSQDDLRSERSKVERSRDKIKLLQFKETTEHNNLLDYKKSHPSKHGWLYRLFH